MREENTFENQKVAEEWIHSVESDEKNSRSNEIYPMLFEWSKQLAPAVILEIGAGQGICSEHLDLSQSTYIGIEPSIPLLERAKSLYPEKTKTFIEATSYDIPLGDESVDAVFSVGVWFHIKDLDRAHKEIARVTKPGGSIFIINANPSVYGVWESFFDAPRKGNMIEGSVQVPAGVLSHNIFYLHEEKEITDSLITNGFTVTSVKRFGFGKDRKEHEGIWIGIEAKKL